MLIYDIETNGLYREVSTIHCIVIYDTEKSKFIICDPDNYPIEYGLNLIKKAKLTGGHNVLGYDLPVIQKLHSDPDEHWMPEGEQLDSYVMAKCMYPDIRRSDFGRWKKGALPGQMIGRHSLEAWGHRIGEYKGDFGKTTDWSKWTPAMTEYCKQDVLVNVKLFEILMRKAENVSTEYLGLEHDVYRILSRQMNYGVAFDIESAEKLYLELNAEREELRRELQEACPPFYKMGKEFTPKRDCRKRVGQWVGYVAGAKMTKIVLTEFNPASSQHITRFLKKKYNWKPTEFSEKTGEPSVTYDVLKALSYPEAKPLARFQMLDKRCGMIADGKQGYLKAYDEKTGRIYGRIDQWGTVSGRCSHQKPNLGQVPASYSPYGPEFRALFWAYFSQEQRGVIVGGDASGLEARCLGHYMGRYDGGAYGEAVVNGDKSKGTDVHTLNMRALGIDSRDNAKTWFYAFLYGSGAANLASIIKQSLKQAKASQKQFFENLPALKKLQDAVKKACKRGYLIGLDGRILKVRSDHSALNLLLQGAGAVIMKKALVLCDQYIRELGFIPIRDYEFVLNVHDEFQIEVRDPENADAIGDCIVRSIRDAGEHFKFRCQLDAEYAVGPTWKETH